MPTREEFECGLALIFDDAERQRMDAIEVSAGNLHRLVGGYPDPSTHRIPVACNVMRKAIKPGDVSLPNTLKRDGASFAVRYRLPR